MTAPSLATCARCGVLLDHEPTEIGILLVSADSGYTVCDGFHGHDQYGLYAPAHTTDLAVDDDPTVVRDGDCPSFTAEMAAANDVKRA